MNAEFVRVEAAHQRLVHRQIVCRQRVPASGELALPGVVAGVVQIQHALASAVQQLVHGFLHRALVVAQDAEHVRALERAIEQHNRHIRRCLADVVVLLRLFLDECRAHEHHAVHMAAGQQLDALLARREIAVRAGQQTIVMLLAEGMLQASQRARQIRVSRIRAEQPDGLHRVQSQTTRKGIGYIAAAVNDLHHLPARLLRHMGAVVQYAGYGCDGYACVAGNIIDVHSRHSPFHSRCVNTSILRVNPHYTRFSPLLQASFSHFRADIHRKFGVLFPRLHKLQEISAEPLTEARKESRINAGVL